MASITTVIISDDMDGSANAETVTFGFDGVTYEIDLSAKNRAKLEKAVTPYIAVARRAPQRRSASLARRTGGTRADRAGVRAWAKEQGLKVSERGRISADIMEQYEESH